MTQLQVEIVTPSRLVVETEASSVTIPGILGYMTVLPAHTDFVSELDIGEIIIQGAQRRSRFFASGGFFQVFSDKLIILADLIEMADDIDTERAESARKRALERLKQRSADTDLMRAQAALKRAQERINMAKALGGLSHH